MSVKDVKALGWDYISLSQKGFGGAVKSYNGSKGNVAICFNFHEAFVVRDDQGLFGVDDLIEGIVKEPSIDIENTGQIEGLSVVAWESDGEVKFAEEEVESLGLSDSDKEDIKKRLISLSGLDKLVDIKF